jgi:type II secretory ATPase GspE/PulE/Tfp pilus assembly ATPase PilB-like protein
MALNDAALKKLLLEQSYVSEEDIVRAEEAAKVHGVSLREALTELELLSQDLYESAVAEFYKLPYYDVGQKPPSAEFVEMLPEDIARSYSCVVVAKDDAGVTVATSDPSNEKLEEIVRANLGQASAEFPEGEEGNRQTARKSAAAAPRFSFGKKKVETRSSFAGKINFVYASNKAIESFFVHYRKPLATRFQQIIEQNHKVAPEILEEIFQDAIALRASDIHFEPQDKEVMVRFRVDGVLHEAGRIPKEYYEGVVNRMKIAANMHIDEHHMAQDGAIRYDTGKGMMDIRVSIVPVVDGEKIVLRLLSEYVRALTLADLGCTEENRKILEQASRKPFGMILTTGPTGSGKSTTLYALLKLRNHPDVNISTIEDPVEYKVQGINHIQVNPETNLTFANGLRALMRQDPNIILVGEIRDGETASIAVNAALTGHLLFSTLHANDACTSIPRLLEMGVEPFLLASTLEVVIAQRLLRKICPHCRYSYTVPKAEVPNLFPNAEKFVDEGGDVLLYKGKGCESCGGIGFQGRLAIHELLAITPPIEALIVARKSSAEIEQEARKSGMKSLFEDGFVKVRSGVTTLEELLRVANPPEQPAGPRPSTSHDKKAA